MQNHTDVLILHTGICAGASQIPLMADANLRFASPPSRKRSGMEIGMYHCHLCIYVIGQSREPVDVLKEIEPLKHFKHEFISSAEPRELLTPKADLIIADLTGLNAQTALRGLAYHMKEGAQLILILSKNQTEKIMEQEADLEKVTDIWTAPVAAKELRFRFARWQRICKESKDYWQTRNYLDTTINSVEHMVWYKDKTGAHMKVNDFFCRTVGKTMEQIEGRGHYYIWNIKPDDYAKGEYICMESEFEVMDKRQTCVFDETIKIGNEMRKLKTYKSPLFDLDGSIMGTVGVALDVTELQMYEQMLIKNASTDALTGLYNRRYVYEYIEGLDEGQNHITVFGIDLDHFKSINDIYGHAEGDKALVLAARTLQECITDGLISRIGGDEFEIVMLGERSAEEIEQTRRMIGAKLNEAFAGDSRLRGITASVGAAHTDRGKENFDRLTGEADALMYREKEKKQKR